MRHTYFKAGYVIETKISKDYAVRALINKIGDKNSKTYDVCLEIREETIGKWDTLDEKHYSIVSDSINTSVLEFIHNKNNDGFFNKFIERYDYELDCFGIGDEVVRRGDTYVYKV